MCYKEISPLKLKIISKYGTMARLSRLANINPRKIWYLLNGNCTLETAVKIERATKGYITCKMIQDYIDKNYIELF